MKQTLFRIWFNGVGLTMWAWNLTEAIILVQAQRINDGLPYEVERADYKDNWGNWCECEMPLSLTASQERVKELEKERDDAIAAANKFNQEAFDKNTERVRYLAAVNLCEDHQPDLDLPFLICPCCLTGELQEKLYSLTQSQTQARAEARSEAFEEVKAMIEQYELNCDCEQYCACADSVLNEFEWKIESKLRSLKSKGGSQGE